MKYGSISDIHANTQAFDAVLAMAQRAGVEKYIFLGDAVGYGADPAACLARLRKLQKSPGCLCVAGNHDFAVAGRTHTRNYSINAVKAIDWTKTVLSPEDISLIGGWPMVLEDNDLTAVHANLHDPASWGYILDIDDADPNFQKLKNKICFVGHSHRPVVFESGKTVDWFLEEQFQLKDKSRYIVNAGSVGQPRDGDPRACFVIYDTDKQVIEFRRAAYDITTAQQRIIQAGLPRMLAERLAQGK